MNNIDFISLGCSKNLVDTERLMRQLSAVGCRVRFEPARLSGDIVVVNTCAFIADAQQESIDMILQLAKRKQQGKIRKLYVMGCLSQRFMQELKTEIDEVDGYFGKFDYMNLVKEIGHNTVPNLMRERCLTTPKHYAYLKIAEGCNRTCSYCAIPLITGPYQSRPMPDIIAEAQWLVEQGVTELIVIAQDLTYYGLDIYHKQNIAELVEQLSDIKGVKRIRLHYAYPTHFPYDLLRVMRERDNVCNYLDLAFQHISDNMLSLMRRGITRQQTYQLIEHIRAQVPGITLRTTLMVGHPGETEQDFQQLLQFVRDVRFERLGAFAFSQEAGTYAAKHYKDDIPDDVKQQRLEKLMMLQDQICDEISENQIGKTVTVVVDRQEATPDGTLYYCRSDAESPDVDDDIVVTAPGRRLRKGHYYNITINDYFSHTYYGEVIKERNDK